MSDFGKAIRAQIRAELVSAEKELDEALRGKDPDVASGDLLGGLNKVREVIRLVECRRRVTMPDERTQILIVRCYECNKTIDVLCADIPCVGQVTFYCSDCNIKCTKAKVLEAS